MVPNNASPVMAATNSGGTTEKTLSNDAPNTAATM